MSLYEKILNKEEKIALVGLGYVGMPLAVEFSKHVNVIGFDINKAKIEAYKNGKDPTQEVGDEAIKAFVVLLCGYCIDDCICCIASYFKEKRIEEQKRFVDQEIKCVLC